MLERVIIYNVVVFCLIVEPLIDILTQKREAHEH